MINKYVSYFLIPVLVLTSCASSKISKSDKIPEIRNIIFMIGDGMGPAHVYAAMSSSETPLNFERCTNTGFQKTFSANSYTTDSGAAGTAIACGIKTKNSSIGVDKDGNVLKSILEIAEDNGLATGIVSTSSVTHATPASFIAHNVNRNNYEALAMDYLKTDIDVFIGGGYNHFTKRADNLDLTDSLRAKGYEVHSTMSTVINSNALKIAGLIAPIHTHYSLDGRGDMLPNATRKAVEVLSKNLKGFFLMIEGSQIDWAGHENDQKNLIAEVLDFDKALGIALDFAEKDGHTLVVVTADHETGGVTIHEGDLNKHEVVLNFSTTHHTGIMIPIYSYGPGANHFNGIMDNTDFFKKFNILYGFDK